MARTLHPTCAAFWNFVARRGGRRIRAADTGYPSLTRESTIPEHAEPMAVATSPYTEKTDDQKAITEMVRQFVDNEVLPVAEEHDHEDTFPEAVVEQMKELGLFGVTIPEEYGGMGLDLTTYTMIVEELSRGWISVSGIVNTHFIGSYLLMKFGTDEQKEHFLPKMATGEVRAAFSLSEPECGSDVQGIKATARRATTATGSSTARRCGSRTDCAPAWSSC